MNARLRFVLVLHCHQPVGNLDSVNESVYQDSYRPLLDALAAWRSLRVNLHVSGSLLDWLVARHPESIVQLRELSSAGRVELLGGAYHDPLLPLLPSRDRRGQIVSFGRRLGELVGAVPRGAWIPERIWEPALVADLAASGIEHAVLDDIHFHRAGLDDAQLGGYYLTEHEGQLAALFAGRERLRYLIPYAPVEQTIDELRQAARQSPGGIVVYADDGEKFGAWPGMHEHVFDHQWLRRLAEALDANSNWLHVTTLGECIDHVPPLGKIYVPEGSYREMDAWAALNDGPQQTTAGTIGQVSGAPPSSVSPLAAGTWRNFRVKYPEVDAMYARMLQVSGRIAAAEREGVDAARLELAQRELYRAQCGCAYWHGLFGGVYLPHLRQAVYRHLIAAECALEADDARNPAWVSAAVDDFNLDVHKELRLTSAHAALLVAPEHGGQLYELDVRAARCNLLASMARRREPYHAGWRGTATSELPDSVDPAHLHTALVYDRQPRRSLVDHFFAVDVAPHDVAAGSAVELGDFTQGRYDLRMERLPRGIRARLARRGRVAGAPVLIEKSITLWADRPQIVIRYELSELPVGRPLRLAVEWNFGGWPGGCAECQFVDADRHVRTDTTGSFTGHDQTEIRLTDRWLALDLHCRLSRPAGIWTYPVRTVSRTQRGLEAIHQALAAVPHWIVSADAQGRWSVEMSLDWTMAGELPPGDGPYITSEEGGERRYLGAGSPMILAMDGPHKSLSPNVLGAPARVVRRHG